MKISIQYKNSYLIYFLIVTIIFIFSKCISDQNNKQQQNIDATSKQQTPLQTVTYNQFRGAQVCANCHKEITAEYFHTNHYLTSRTASAKSIKGSFINGQNSFMYDADRVVRLEKRKDSFYQVYYYKGDEHVVRRFDIVVGSGTKGQTYLSWVNNQLIELPVSYFTTVHEWANSPGYPLYPTLFNRPATTRCLECHSTFAATLTAPLQEPEKFDSTKMILSVSCEKCHGPAAKHVEYELKNPGDRTGKFIVNPAKLSTKLNIDVCALCHAGRLQKTKPSFEFIAGDILSNYFLIDSLAQPVNNIDVHGNQLGLLQASKCFRVSKIMTCTTCHDPHNDERNNMQFYSQKCMSCHTEQHKPVDGLSNKELIKNCIDCHMPLQSSMSISFLLQGEHVPTHAQMCTHFITVYPGETKKFVENFKTVQKEKL